jgi:hypothetical protein
MSEVSIKPIIHQIEIMFDDLNKKLFESALSKPVITVNTDNNKDILGWCTSWKAWKDNDNNGYYEINISCDYLDRNINEIATTLLHEMIHLFCVENCIKDTSRSGTYHNKKYKENAESHGLIVECDAKRGWTKTTLNEDMRKYVSKKYQNIDLVYNAAVKAEKEKKKSSTRKYVCPNCSITVRATKEVKILCFDCDEMMVLEEND